MQIDSSVSEELVLDGHKLGWHHDRVKAWERGERIAPVTIDMALTRKCDYACSFCFAMTQANTGGVIDGRVMDRFLGDCARMGVRGISLVSDGESLLSPVYAYTVQRGAELGISMASGTNGRVFTNEVLNLVLPKLTYLRFNFSAGTRQRYAEIMGTKPESYDRVTENVKAAVAIKQRRGITVTIGLQMVLMPQDADQILPFAELGRSLGVDYAVIKHCSDTEYGELGVDYSKYAELRGLLDEAESLSTEDYSCRVKWSKIDQGNVRPYQRCYGPPFLLQISGSGLVAPCGQLFNDRYAKFHMGNICEQSFYDIWQSDWYWEVMGYLSSDKFNAQDMCAVLCLQDRINVDLDRHVKGETQLEAATGPQPQHVNFV